MHDLAFAVRRRAVSDQACFDFDFIGYHFPTFDAWAQRVQPVRGPTRACASAFRQPRNMCLWAER
jgi:hypothetical protein